MVAGVVVWLILASSITLEHGQHAAAKWGSAATLAVLGIAVLLVLSCAALTPTAGPRPPDPPPRHRGRDETATGQGSRGQRPAWPPR